jgi:hypothetical protein
MTRLVLGVAVAMGSLSGCASPARYVERTGDTGVVAIPNNTDSWPNYNRREAMALIQKHVGGNFEIVEEREVATGKKTFNDQQVNNEQTWNTANPLLPANRQTVQNTTTTQDVTEYRIAYRRKAAPLGSPKPALPATIGLQGPATPALPNVQQTQYTPGSATGVQPAGGIAAPAGPTAPVIPAVGPVPPSGSGVYGSAGMTFGSMR